VQRPNALASARKTNMFCDKNVNAVCYKFTRAKSTRVKLRGKKAAEVASDAKTTLRVFLVENSNFTQALSAQNASRSDPSPSRETSLNPQALELPISIMTSYAMQKVARDMLLILTTCCFGNAQNVETSRSIKTTSREGNLGISRIRAISRTSGEADVKMLTIFAITRSPSSLGWPRATMLRSPRCPPGRKETLILIRAVKGNYPLTVCNVLWLI